MFRSGLQKTRLEKEYDFEGARNDNSRVSGAARRRISLVLVMTLDTQGLGVKVTLNITLVGNKHICPARVGG